MTIKGRKHIEKALLERKRIASIMFSRRECTEIKPLRNAFSKKEEDKNYNDIERNYSP